MIHIKSFVTEGAVDFITILEEDFPQEDFRNTVFTSFCPRFSISLIGYRNFSVLCTCHV